MIDLDYPKTPQAFVGARQRELAQRFLEGKISQTMLFLGPSGIGKTSLAKFVAHQVLVDVELIQINCREQKSIAFVRELVAGFPRRSLRARYTVYLLDEIHGWSGDAQEALLIALEPPPSHVYILAASTAPELLETTLQTRFNTYPLTVPTMKEQAAWVLDELLAHGVGVEGYTTAPTMLTKAEATDLVYAAQGSIRALKRIVQQKIDGTFAAVHTDAPSVETLVGAIFKGKGNPYRATDKAETALVGLCTYALRILQNDPSNVLARRVLQNFGKGLPPGVPKDVGLAHLIATFDLDC